MPIRPLKGQVLVRIVPNPYKTDCGIDLPDIARDGSTGEKAPARKAIVIAIGPWRTTRSQLAVVPDFHTGQTVLVSEYAGSKLSGDIGKNYKICRVDDILAVVEEHIEA